MLHFVALSASLPSCTHDLSCLFFWFFFYALCAMSIHCTVPLLFNSAAALPSFFTHESPSTTTIITTLIATTTISYLFCILIVSVLLVHEIFAIPLHAHIHANLLHNSSVLSDHHGNSLASLAVFPRVQHHWVLC
jgi:hypothetical protein